MASSRLWASAARGAGCWVGGMAMDPALVQQRVDFMGRVPLLRRLNVQERTELVYEMTEQRFARGEQIIVQGDSGSEMFIVEEGEATAFVAGVQIEGHPPGEVQRYATGDYFGEQALITNKPRGATVVATTPVLALTLGVEAFQRLVGNVGAVMEEARRRLRAASYVKGRRDYKRLFHYYNRSGDGKLDWSEFRALIRKDGRMTAAMMTEKELRTLFCMVDFKGYGYIDEEEFLHFVQVTGEDEQEPEVDAQETLSPAELARRIELLRDVKIFRSLNGRECRAVAKTLAVQEYTAGKNVITAGEAGTEMFIVQEGELEAVSADETTHYVDYSPGSSFGELALLSNAPRSATVRALGDCTLLRLRRRTFDKLVGNVGACMEELRRRFKAAAYTTGRLDYAKLFAQYNHSNSGSLDWEEFNSAVRKYGHVSTKVATDREVQVLFDMIDLDQNNSISLEEFYIFLGLTKDGKPKEDSSSEAHKQSFSYHLSLEDVELRLKKMSSAPQRIVEEEEIREQRKASRSNSQLRSRSRLQYQSTSTQARPRAAAAAAAGCHASTVVTGGDLAQTPPRATVQPSAADADVTLSDNHGEARSHRGAEVQSAVQVGDSELVMPVEREATVPVYQPWLPMSHAAAGQVPIAANLWGAGRRALPELDPLTPAAGVTWLGAAEGGRAPQFSSDTSTRIAASAEASLSAWGSTVRFSPTPSEGARDSATGGTGRSAMHAVAADHLARDPGAEAAAEARYATVWGLMSPGMRAMAVAEESQRWAMDSGRNDTSESGAGTEVVHAAASAQPADRQEMPTDKPSVLSSPARRRQHMGDASGNASRRQRPAGRSSITSRTTSLLNGRIAEQLDRRYTTFESSRLERGHVAE